MKPQQLSCELREGNSPDLTNRRRAAELAREEWNENKAFCEYCQIASLASFASLALAVPEVTRAIRTLTGQSDQS